MFREAAKKSFFSGPATKALRPPPPLLVAGPLKKLFLQLP